MKIKELIKRYSESKGSQWATTGEIDRKFLSFCKNYFIAGNTVSDEMIHEFYGLGTIEHLIIESHEHSKMNVGYIWSNWISPNLANKEYSHLFPLKRVSEKVRQALDVNSTSVTHDNIFKFYNWMILKFLCSSLNSEPYLSFLDMDFAYYRYAKKSPAPDYKFSKHYLSFLLYSHATQTRDIACMMTCLKCGYFKTDYYNNLSEVLGDISKLNNASIESIVINEMGYVYFSDFEKQQVVDLSYPNTPVIEAMTRFNTSLNLYESGKYALLPKEITALIEPLISSIELTLESFNNLSTINQSLNLFRHKLSLTLLDRNRLGSTASNPSLDTHLKAYLVFSTLKESLQPVRVQLETFAMESDESLSVKAILEKEFAEKNSSDSYEMIMSSVFQSYFNRSKKIYLDYEENRQWTIDPTIYKAMESMDKNSVLISTAISKLVSKSIK